MQAQTKNGPASCRQLRVVVLICRRPLFVGYRKVILLTRAARRFRCLSVYWKLVVDTEHVLEYGEIILGNNCAGVVSSFSLDPAEGEK